ncbi:MAG: hypothetical protein HQK49_20520 [Oligoflexia bacterium]|nr:hypothetical protein [Oligoflexia bacterium]
MKKTSVTPANENLPLYLFYYSKGILKNLLTKQKLYTGANPPSVKADITLTPKIVADWCNLFELSVPVQNSQHQHSSIPHLPYFSSAITLSFIDLLTSININFNNLLFTKWVVKINNNHHQGQTENLIIGQKYTLHTEISSISIISAHSIFVGTKTNVTNSSNHHLISTSNNYFKVTKMNINKNTIMPLTLTEDKLQPMRGLSKRRPQLKDPFLSKKIFIPVGFPLKFGRVSGDFSINHTTNFTAKYLLKFPKAFIQGICTSSYIFKIIASDLNIDLHDFEMTFCNPIFVDQYININININSDNSNRNNSNDNKNYLYEITDENNLLLAFGSFGSFR